MKVLFINFNLGSTPGINNGLAVLSAMLKKEGHKVGLIFLCEELGYDFNRERIRRDIAGFGPDILGLSLMETQLKYAAELLKGIRQYYKGFIICGGPYPTMDPEGCLSLDGVDAVCVGEGEGAVCEVAEALASGADTSRIKNIWLKKRGEVIKNRLRPFIDLNGLPPDDKELFDLERILPLKNYQLETMVGRGCIYQCSYCINESYVKKYRQLCERPVTMKDYIRFKRIDAAISEIKDTVARHPTIKKVAFIDDNFIMDEGYLSDFCAEYKKEVGLPFMCNANPVSYSASKARILKDGGCDDVRFGIESGSERLKKEILNRPIPNRKAEEAFRINRHLGLMASSFNMIGLPTETKEEVFETLRLNARVMPDTVKVMTFYPFKNTPIYDLCERMALIDYDRKYELQNYDTFTCLKFPADHRLFLKKMQACFNWYLNVLLGNEASEEYRKLTDRAESMDEPEWDGYDCRAADEEISRRMREENITHYSKFINRSLAVKFPSGHFSKEVRDAG